MTQFHVTPGDSLIEIANQSDFKQSKKFASLENGYNFSFESRDKAYNSLDNHMEESISEGQNVSDVKIESYRANPYFQTSPDIVNQTIRSQILSEPAYNSSQESSPQIDSNDVEPKPIKNSIGYLKALSK